MEISELNNFYQRSPDWLMPVWDEFTKAASHGYLVTPHGVLAVCPRKVTQIGESEWLHFAVPGVPAEHLNDIELDLGFRNNRPEADVLKLGIAHVTGGFDFDHYVPAEIKQLLFATNGLSLFGGHLCIWGIQTLSASLRNEYYKDIKWQDGSMTFCNIWGRPWKLEPRILTFGVYPSNGSILYMRENDSAVYNCDRIGEKTIKKWDSIGEWITEEISRFNILFDHKARIGSINEV